MLRPATVKRVGSAISGKTASGGAYRLTIELSGEPDAEALLVDAIERDLKELRDALLTDAQSGTPYS